MKTAPAGNRGLTKPTVEESRMAAVKRTCFTPEEWADRYELDPSTGCHLWRRATQTRGYGVVWFAGKVHLAHRVAWLAAHGRWPDADRVIDHVCNNKACVNPDHLRELENWQNIRRAYEKKADPAAERRRALNRASQAKSRGNYSPTYSPERG